MTEMLTFNAGARSLANGVLLMKLIGVLRDSDRLTETEINTIFSGAVAELTLRLPGLDTENAISLIGKMRSRFPENHV